MIDLDTLFKISYGMYIVSSKGEIGINGCIVNSIFQITPEPVTIAVSINKQSLTCLYIEEGKSFSVSVLSEEAPMQFIGRFGFCCGREADKFKGVNYKIGKTGNPIILDNTVAYIEAEVTDTVDIFTHTLFIARVVACETLDDSKSPMTYSYYRDIRGGKTPKQAATYHKEKITQKREK